jgi:hypothetical protein
VESKFRYLLFPDNVYRLTFHDHSGNELIVDALGKDILDQVKSNYVLDNYSGGP